LRGQQERLADALGGHVGLSYKSWHKRAEGQRGGRRSRKSHNTGGRGGPAVNGLVRTGHWNQKEEDSPVFWGCFVQQPPINGGWGRKSYRRPGGEKRKER